MGLCPNDFSCGTGWHAWRYLYQSQRGNPGTGWAHHLGAIKRSTVTGRPTLPLDPAHSSHPLNRLCSTTRQQCLQSEFPWLQKFAVKKECQTEFCKFSTCKKLCIQGELCQEWEDRPTGRRVAMMTCQLGSGGGKSNNPKSQWLPLPCPFWCFKIYIVTLVELIFWVDFNRLQWKLQTMYCLLTYGSKLFCLFF